MRQLINIISKEREKDKEEGERGGRAKDKGKKKESAYPHYRNGSRKRKGVGLYVTGGVPLGGSSRKKKAAS